MKQSTLMSSKMPSKANALICSLLLTVSLSACQQTKLVFTDTKEPVISDFKGLNGAPQVNLGQIDDNVWKVNELTKSVTLHQYPPSRSKLTYLSLVLVNPKHPFKNIDLINTALYQRAYTLATTSKLSCIESFRVQAGMHSIALQLACPETEAVQALTLLMGSWQTDAFDSIDLDTVRRQLKLNKHINAYSGGEIDKVWAKKILGEHHPYNLNLHNPALQNELSSKELIEQQQALLAGSSWHLLVSSNTNDMVAKLAKMLTLHLPSSSVNDKKQGLSDTLTYRKPLEELFTQNPQKQLYIIDAPGAIQTQVRVGYRLPIVDDELTNTTRYLDESDPLSCQLLASWLGRSFSGRLYYDLREKRGLTYGIYGRCFDNPQARTLKFYGSTQRQHTGAFISGILDHLALASESEPKAAELSALKIHEKSKYLLASQSINAAFSRYIKQLSQGRQNTALSQEKTVNQLSAKTVQNMAETIFSTPPTILIRGDVDLIIKDLQDKLPEWTINQIKP